MTEFTAVVLITGLGVACLLDLIAVLYFMSANKVEHMLLSFLILIGLLFAMVTIAMVMAFTYRIYI